MATQITQTTTTDGKTVLRVEGDMLLDDAILLERLVQSGEHGVGINMLIDLADLDFIDSDAASVLKRLRDDHGVQIEGVEIFLQSAINSVER
jgi:anti-anti-sigma factor